MSPAVTIQSNYKLCRRPNLSFMLSWILQSPFGSDCLSMLKLSHLKLRPMFIGQLVHNIWFVRIFWNTTGTVFQCLKSRFEIFDVQIKFLKFSLVSESAVVLVVVLPRVETRIDFLCSLTRFFGVMFISKFEVLVNKWIANKLTSWVKQKKV